MVDLYLRDHPDKIKDQYLKPPKDYENDEEVITFITNIKKYYPKYNEIILNICKESSNNVCLFLLNYIYENKFFEFFKVKNDEDWMPIHFICEYQNEKCVMRILDIHEKLKLDFEVKNNENWTPIHFICIFCR